MGNPQDFRALKLEHSSNVSTLKEKFQKKHLRIKNNIYLIIKSTYTLYLSLQQLLVEGKSMISKGLYTFNPQEVPTGRAGQLC